MNKEDFRLSYFDEFREPQVRIPLKIASEDTNKFPHVYMTEHAQKVISMDAVMDGYLIKRGMHKGDAKSVDALYMLSSGKLCMVEFKNGEFTPAEIIEKALSSVLMFNEITETNISFTRENMVFVLVYNQEVKHVNYRQLYAEQRSHRQKERISLFKLDHLNHFCFSQVEEIEKTEFDSSKFVKELMLN